MQLNFINIGVHVTPDGMAAHLSLDPIEGVAAGALSADNLNSALQSVGVIRGVDLAALRDIAADWRNNPRSLKTPSVANGKEAVAEKMGALHISVKHLALPDDVKAATDSRYFYELSSMAHKFQRVDRGAIVAKRMVGVPGVVGYDVYGTPKTADGQADAKDSSIHEEHNIYRARHTYTAACTGIVYVDGDEEPKIHPLNFDGAVELQIASDKMSAELTALPAGEGGSMPSEEFVRALLNKNGVVSGINNEALAKLLIQFANGIDSQMSLTVASGKPAVKGSDGWVEFNFNKESSPTPFINPDGSADYKKINIVTTVAAGSILAKLHPPSKGAPGVDITGFVLPALDGNPAMLPVGTNTAVPKESPATLVAVANGIVRFDGSAVNIAEGYAIQGDVDFATGNISYENSITVGGDIKSGFEVKCGEDLQVNGIIEDAAVTVKGNVLCRYGFVGRGKGIIEAEGDVNLGYMKNQTLISNGVVNIAKEAINCNITGRKGINIYGQHLSAAGGTLISNSSIILKTVGNISAVSTTLVIEPKPELVEELAKSKADIEIQETNMKKLTTSLNSMTLAQKSDKEFVRKIKNSIVAINQHLAALIDKKRLLTIAINKFENCFIRIDSCAYPGTVIKFGQYIMTLTERLIGGKTVRVINQEIKVI